MKIAWTKQRTAILLSVGLATGVCGCAWSVGSPSKGSTTQTPATIAPTQGQQLIDLKRALEADAITQEEYDTQRQKLLEP